MDIILTNSQNTKNRIQKYLGYDAEILYPPVDTKRFIATWNKGYFLSFARLADAKRVDRIIQAFQELPEEKLVIIYGKNDPQKQKIFELAKGYSNITLLTLEDNNMLFDYVGSARATIYIPIDEDFGMIPIESMSAGKPVLWVDDGGLKETILHEKTWYLIGEQANIEDIRNAVKYLSQEKCESMKQDCENRAKEFWLDSFEAKLKEITSRV